MNKILKIILIYQWLNNCLAYITSDYGVAVTNGATALSSTNTLQQNFNGVFQNVPQVMITSIYSSTGLASSQFGYQVSITEITTTYFKILLSANYANINVQSFTYVALDDQRFEIVNVFNQANPTSTSVPHSNKNVKTGFIALISYGAKTPIKFVLSIDSITDTNVNVKITDETLSANPSNLLNIGYAIVLGPEGAFSTNFFPLIPQLFSNTAAKYCSPVITLTSDIIWIYYSIYFSYSTTLGIRVRFDVTSSNNQVSYCFCTWGTGYNTFTKYGHSATTINLVLPSLLPMLMRKIRVSRSNILENVNTFQVSIPELNKNYNSIINELLEVPKSTQSLTINIKVKCQPNQKVSGMFQRYISGSNQYYASQSVCFLGQNIISFFVKYYQAIQQYQYIVVSITADQVQIIQKLSNQQIELKTIAQANFLQ